MPLGENMIEAYTLHLIGLHLPLHWCSNREFGVSAAMCYPTGFMPFLVENSTRFNSLQTFCLGEVNQTPFSYLTLHHENVFSYFPKPVEGKCLVKCKYFPMQSAT